VKARGFHPSIVTIGLNGANALTLVLSLENLKLEVES